MLGRLFGALLVGVLLGLAGCATTALPHPESATPKPALQHWQGRIGIRITEPQPQSFSAGFTLDGNASRGTLMLLSPLGTTLAVMQWAPGSATLSTGAAPRVFDSLAALTQTALGMDLPITALFDWLQGSATAVEGWEPDLTDLSGGKIRAKRVAPNLDVELQVLLSNP